jgi:zinc transporter, ZIP family
MVLARASIAIPLILVAALVAGFLASRPFDYLAKGVPPVEEITIENVRLDEDGIHATIRAAGSEPVTVAQVQVDGAYAQFTQQPEGPISYLESARIDIAYPWVTGEAHHLTFVTKAGATFEHTIEVAVETPGAGPADFVGLALVGLFVGFIPILIGYAFYPALMSFGDSGRDFAMALTVGLLAFLLIDTLGEGLEVAEKAASGLKASLIVWLSAILTTLILLAIGRRKGRPPDGMALALFIAVGIGIHNLGEGLAIGASLSAGEVALASFLVLGFALHNVTEGIAISAPIRREDVSIPALVWLALIGGGPAVVGTLSGGLSLSPFWIALAFGIGAGAILQVIIEVGGVFLRRRRGQAVPWYSAATLSGFMAGIFIMYLTAFMVHG